MKNAALNFLAITIFVLVLISFSIAQEITFGMPTTYSVGEWPISIAVGDLNGDGCFDLVVGNVESNSVSILLGDGTGSFGEATSIAMESETESAPDPFYIGAPAAIAINDLNGDGNLDLVAANFSRVAWNENDYVSILLGDGSGTFGALKNFAIGRYARSVAIGDLNGDGNLDLSVAIGPKNNIAILLGDGTGSFGEATNFAVGNHPRSLALGDFNGDGNLDLAVANSNSDSVSILLGGGDGNFGATTNYPVRHSPYDVGIGDLNGDGSLDLAVVNFMLNNVAILLGDGTGSFGATTNFAAIDNAPYEYTRAVAIQDLNGDGNLDLVVVVGIGISILPGDGSGTFGTYTHFEYGDFAFSDIALGDFNGDGLLDLAGVSNVENNVTILLNSTIIPVPGNNPPVLAPVGARSLNEGETLQFTLSASDPDGDPLTFSSGMLPSGAALDSSSGVFSYTPGFDVSTNLMDSFFDVEFEVSDGRGGSDSETIRITVIDVLGGTPAGSGVVVTPEDLTPGDTPVVTLTFDQIVEGGITTVATSSTGPPPSQGFKLGNPPSYFEITTTATTSGQIEVCFDYSNINFGGQEENLKLFHFEDSNGDGINDTWVDCTCSIDTDNDIICACVSTLSPFVIFEPEDLGIKIDILPGKEPNNIDPYSRGVIEVAILGNPDFDVRYVHVSSLRLGPDGANNIHRLSDPTVYSQHLQDINGDGINDLITHYLIRETGIRCQHKKLTLAGRTLTGQKIVGTDSVRTVGWRCLIFRPFRWFRFR